MLTSNDIDAVCGLVIDLCGVYLDESKALPHRGAARRARQEFRLRELRRVCPPRAARLPTIRFATRSSTPSPRTKRCSSATARRSTRLQNKVIPETIDSKAGTPFAKRTSHLVRRLQHRPGAL